MVSSDNTYEEAQADEINISPNDGECEENAASGVDVDLTVLSSTVVYPEDYPQEGDTICVVGTFDTYMEGEYMYCTLRNTVLA